MKRLHLIGIDEISPVRMALVTIGLSVFFTCLGIPTAQAAPSDDFVTTWKTNNPGTSNSTSITVPMVGGPYDVDWNGDGVFDAFGLSGTVTHDYGVVGTYTVRIRGDYDSIRINSYGDREKIISLDQWGTNSWTSMDSAFRWAINLTVPATDIPDFSAVISMAFMFFGATSANPDTSAWNTAAVVSMRWMFSTTTSANPDTSGWDTSAVKDMSNMFAGTTSANPDTSNWNTSAVTNMERMFLNATSANPDTSGWNTGAVINMGGMFHSAISANPDTSGWNTSAVTNMSWMFYGATSANPDTSGWNTEMVRNMSLMFRNAPSANPDTSGWNTGAVINMGGMFHSAISANPDTSGWNTVAVIDMSWMFLNAPSFDRDLGSWNVTAMTNADKMFNGVTLSTANYESLLIGWNAQALQPGVTFDGGNSTVCSESAIAAKNHMISSDSWTISDGGTACPPPEITCNLNTVYGDTEYFDVSHEACDNLLIAPGLIAKDGASVKFSAGSEINIMRDVLIEKGATLEAGVCGQSLCEISSSPMLYGCHSCVDQICDIDPSCCDTAWGQACVDKVDTVCGLVCE